MVIPVWQIYRGHNMDKLMADWETFMANPDNGDIREPHSQHRMGR